ncbi:15435_t:CDS:2 [Cetraspora pellucida]|uniref:15435_t:CDS:1 n=1 Tax=Cetraspora pellucida TaxID=1433469 RepID=A0A9N8ZPZ1_9GLOM|nr:15435_t:CDS:2 [Cetraspora pellucida]
MFTGPLISSLKLEDGVMSQLNSTALRQDNSRDNKSNPTFTQQTDKLAKAN